MLKILKNELKTAWNLVKYPLIAVVILSVLLGILDGFRYKADIPFRFSVIAWGGTVWFAVMTVLFVLTWVRIFGSLSRDMFGKEAYLTHTLPVSHWELLVGKVLGVWLFGLFMLAVVGLSFGFIASLSIVVQRNFSGILYGITQIFAALTPRHYLWGLAGLFWLLLGTASFVVQLQFLCIACRQLGRFFLPAGIVLFVLLGDIESKLSTLIPFPALVLLLISSACFYGSLWLLKHRLQIG